MNKQNKIIIGSAVFLSAAIIIFGIISNNINSIVENNIPGFYDQFAQCLTSKRATMFGAAWCLHCREQKAVFGDSFKYINYVECPQNTQSCIDKGVQVFPTWLIGTSTKLEGFVENKTMKELSEAAECPLPQYNL